MFYEVENMIAGLVGYDSIWYSLKRILRILDSEPLGVRPHEIPMKKIKWD